MFSGSTKNTAIGKDRVSAKYSETTDVWDEGKILCGAYLCPLSNGNVLLIETQSYTIGENASYAQDIQNMLNSIVLK